MKVRFVAFSAVGAIGFVLQLGTLWLLTSRLGVHYLAAATVGTEFAILPELLRPRMVDLVGSAGRRPGSPSPLRPVSHRQSRYLACREQSA